MTFFADSITQHYNGWTVSLPLHVRWAWVVSTAQRGTVSKVGVFSAGKPAPHMRRNCAIHAGNR